MTPSLRIAGLLTILLLLLTSWVPGRANADEDDCTELVANSDMEGASGWTFPAGPNAGGYDATRFTSPIRSALLGIVDGDNLNAVSSMRQPVKVPAGAQLLLSWRGLPLSQPLDYQDAQRVHILGPDNSLKLRVWDDFRNDDQWLTCSFDVSEFLGSDIVLDFGVVNNGSNGRTALFVDDVSLKVCQTRQTLPEGCILPTVEATPTPTATPTATETPIPSETPAGTATPTATLTATPAWRLYLPMLSLSPEASF